MDRSFEGGGCFVCCSASKQAADENKVRIDPCWLLTMTVPKVSLRWASSPTVKSE